MSRLGWLLVVLPALACPPPNRAPACRRTLVAGGPTVGTFIISSRETTTLVLTAEDATCDDDELIAELITEATLTTTRGERRPLTVTRVARSLRSPGTALDVLLDVPPTPVGNSTLRVFIEPGLAVLDALLLSPVERAEEPGISLPALSCDVLAISSSRTRYCTRGATTLVSRGAEQSTLLDTTARAVGDIVWTMQPLGGGVHELKRWRERSDGGLEPLGAARGLTNQLLAVTEHQALTNLQRWNFEDDGGVTEAPLGPLRLATVCGAMLEPDGAFFFGETTVCEGRENGCFELSSPGPRVAAGFDERSVWLVDDLRAGATTTPPRLARYTRPLRREAPASAVVALPAGYTIERVQCLTQGTSPVVLRDQQRRQLLLLRDTETGLEAERFAPLRVVLLTHDWLVLGADDDRHRIFSLRD
ncbi:MAG: hypothetical protein MUC96_19090 [Myxococcaceae bacterium]|nr:hypothetical protein [Myxococcaceae bacterium]